MAPDPLRAGADARGSSGPGLTLRGFAALLVVGLHLAFGWMLFGRDAPVAPGEPPARERRARTEPEPRPHPSLPNRPRAESAAPTPAPSGPPAASAGELAAYERGRAYSRAWQASIRRWREQRYGPDIAALHDQPVAATWRALEALVAEGDTAAAAALYELHGFCASDGAPEEMMSRLDRQGTFEGLARPDAAFVYGALEAEVEYFTGLQGECAASGLDHRRLVDVMQRHRAARRLDPAEVPTRSHLLDAWTETFGDAGGGDAPVSSPEARSWIARIDAREAIGEADMAEFERLAWNEPVLLNRVVYCLLGGCDSLDRATVPDADAWIDRAAELGNEQAIADRAARAARAGRDVEAWAWHAYARWVAAQGCSVLPSILAYASAARAMSQAAERLDAASLERARALGAALVARHGPQARRAEGCAG